MRSVFILLLLGSLTAMSQVHQQPSASEIRLRLKKLNFLGSVLYVAAHPDDENTRAISFFASDQLAATAYLSLTRGDGGQNLIGSEIRDQLGLIRTQELLSARRIDGGQQFFTRANDFGFSKNVNETFEIWNRNELLTDVVRVYRQFQPDIILTRFPPDERAGHGQHTASGVLAQEAFDKSNDATFAPDLATEFGVWQPKRLYTNTGRWWNQTINDKTPGVITVNVGTYNALLGKSYSEIAAQSRSQHKSQGFGSTGRRGDAPEYFEYVKGEKATKTLFDGVNTSWTRVPGGGHIGQLVDQVLREFNDENPSLSVAGLVRVRGEIQALPSSIWKTRKLKEVEALIQDCLGLFVEASVTTEWTSPGQPVNVSIELINRSNVPTIFTHIKSSALDYDSAAQVTLTNNVALTLRTSRKLRTDVAYSDPYWLRQAHDRGLFVVSPSSLIGTPENEPAASVVATFAIGSQVLDITVPVVYKRNDPVKGELTQPFAVVPPVFVNFEKSTYLFKTPTTHDVSVVVKSATPAVQGAVSLQLPMGWKSEPASIDFSLARSGEEQWFTFRVTPTADEKVESIGARVTLNGKAYDKSIKTIRYDHIPTQILLPPASAEVMRINLKNSGTTIVYLRGAGDEVPASLRAMGYTVLELEDDEVTAATLKKVDAVVLGVRVLNTNDRIRHIMPVLLDYVKEGGTMVVQYNTNFELHIDADKFSPYPLTLSRDRVTQEDCEVRVLKPDHPLLNQPNKITAADFSGWVQERGLYFPSKWAPEFEPLLSMNDTGEPARDGSLLVARYGKGVYIYASLSFFRELPEGVPGAYKLFANLVSASSSMMLPASTPKKSGK